MRKGESWDAVGDDGQDAGRPPGAPAGPSGRGEDLRGALELARSCHYEERHAGQVTRLALALFDQLGAVHGLGAEARGRLRAAAILHDIGWVRGPSGHHKTAQRIIMASPILALDDRARRIIGCIARYHRKAVPSMAHAEFAALGPADQRLVQALAAILRVADALDSTHQSLVGNLSVETAQDKVTLRCQVGGDATEESRKAILKGDLFERVFKRKLVVMMGP